MAQGWISLHRQLQDSWIYNKKPYDLTHAWIDLLLRANHSDNKFLLGTELIEIERGSFITSIRKLCEAWGWSNTKLEKYLKLLESEKMIAYKSDTKKTTITIVNYSVYQDIDDSKKDTKTSQKHHTNDTKASQKRTNNNDNNENNENNDNKYTSNEVLDAAIKSFIDMRKKIKKPMTDNAIPLMIKKLDKLGNSDEERIAILEQSIMNSWQGIFALKEDNNGGNRRDNNKTTDKPKYDFSRFEYKE